MIIQETIIIKLHPNNIKHYESLGYFIPRYFNKSNYEMMVKEGTTIEVNVKDLLPGCQLKVQCKCDLCGKENNWINYSSIIKKFGKYICKSCSIIGRKHSDETKKKMSDNNAFKGKFGNEHSCWNPNISDEERINKRKKSLKLGWWRKIIKKRDNYICQCCGYVGKINDNFMVAHHIDCWIDFKDLRTDVNNGITLCKDCHSSDKGLGIHNIYGYKTTREQLNEFFKIKQ